MKNNFLLVCFLLISTHSLFGQSEEVQRKSYVTFDVLSPIASYSPAWKVGYFRKINDQFIIGAEVGIGTYGTSINFVGDGDWIENDYFKFEVSPELIYVLNPNHTFENFVSAEAFYIRHTDSFENSSYRSETNSQYFNYDSADYRRQKFGLNLNYGAIINFSKRFGLIPKVGFGVRVRSVDFSNIVNPELDPNNQGEDGGLVESVAPNIRDFLEIEGSVTRLNFNFDIKLFYKF
ncbi:hypothetical protein [Dokdonia sp.]|uniref:hypothetical protein n=1 Tax=Dokdonia sp. TaxID=2024995 RepID=UPI003267A182